MATQGLLGTGFLAYTVFASNPLARLARPGEGRSQPAAAGPGARGPPAVPLRGLCRPLGGFLAVAALIEGRVDAGWSRWVRPWTLAAWSMLTVGITLGSFWAYYELGWGGWWFWDPVENASFMPWLVATACCTRRSSPRSAARWRAGPSSWRSGLHLLDAGRLPGALGRADHRPRLRGRPERAACLLLISGAIGGSLALFAWRAPALQGRRLFAPISRESALVMNNILLAAATATVLLGTLYPLIREATGEADLGRPALLQPDLHAADGAAADPVPVGRCWPGSAATAGAVRRLWVALLIAPSALLALLG